MLLLVIVVVVAVVVVVVVAVVVILIIVLVQLLLFLLVLLLLPLLLLLLLLLRRRRRLLLLLLRRLLILVIIVLIMTRVVGASLCSGHALRGGGLCRGLCPGTALGAGVRTTVGRPFPQSEGAVPWIPTWVFKAAQNPELPFATGMGFRGHCKIGLCALTKLHALAARG